MWLLNFSGKQKDRISGLKNRLMESQRLFFSSAKRIPLDAPCDHEDVYQPAEDTRLLQRAALAEARPGTMEIGCGSGFVSQELARKVARLIATDINPHAVRTARARGIEVVRADLFQGIKGKFDLILFDLAVPPAPMQARAREPGAPLRRIPPRPEGLPPGTLRARPGSQRAAEPYCA